uniref:Uncharacterized protein n=1 Tax=Arundo donax TaxID=35708 RepID=A0A0A9A5U8_ARUDO
MVLCILHGHCSCSYHIQVQHQKIHNVTPDI